MSELSYNHDPDNGCIELMVNKKVIATWVCYGDDPELEFADFKKIYAAGQEIAYKSGFMRGYDQQGSLVDPENEARECAAIYAI